MNELSLLKFAPLRIYLIIFLSNILRNLFFFSVQTYDNVNNNASQYTSALLAEASDRINTFDGSLDSLNITFTANWMLVVTWRAVPAYKAEFVSLDVSMAFYTKTK